MTQPLDTSEHCPEADEDATPATAAKSAAPKGEGSDKKDAGKAVGNHAHYLPGYNGSTEHTNCVQVGFMFDSILLM